MSHQGFHSYGSNPRSYSNHRPPRMIVASPRSTASSKKPSIQTYPPVQSATFARHPLVTNRVNRKEELVKIRLKKSGSHSRSKPSLRISRRNDYHHYQRNWPPVETGVVVQKPTPPIQRNKYYEESRDSENYRDYPTRGRSRRRKSPMRSVSGTFDSIRRSFSSDSSRSSRDSNLRRNTSNHSGSWKGSSGSRGSRNSSRRAIKRKNSSDSEESYSNNRGRFSKCPHSEAIEENWPIVLTVLLCGVFLSLG